MNAIYSNALAKSRENKMLGVERLYRMIDAPNFFDALKILSEVGFGGVEVDGDYEKLIERELSELYAFVRHDAPNENFKKFFLYPNDFHNVEVFIKGKHTPIDVDLMTVEDGIYSKDKLKNDIMLDNYLAYPKSLQVALGKCDLEFANGTATGLKVSSLIKKALYSELFAISKKDKILKEIYGAKADFANVSIALRSRDYSFTLEHRVVGGTLSENDIRVLTEEPFDSLKERFKTRAEKVNVYSAIEDASLGKPLAEFEKNAESFAVKKLKAKKYEISGIYPFVNYCFNKLIEIDNVRIVLAGKQAGLDSMDIKGRLRDSYEG